MSGKATATLGIKIESGGAKANAKAVANGISFITKELHKLAVESVKAGKLEIGAVFGNAANGLNKFNDSMKNLSSTSKKTAGAVKEVVAPFSDMEKQIKGIQGVWKHYGDVSNKTVESTKKNAQYTRNLSDSLSGLAKQITDAGGAGDAWLKRVKASNLVRARENKLIDDSGRVIKDLTKAQLTGLGISGKTQEAYSKSLKTRRLYDEQVGKGIKKTKEYQKSIETLGRKFQWADEATSRWAPKLKTANQALTALNMSSKAMSKSSKDMVSGLKLTDVTLSSLGKNVKVTKDGIQVLNRAGMKELGISSQKTAKEVGLLSKSFKMVSDSAPAKAIRKITSEFPEAVKASSELRKELRGMHSGFKKTGDGGKALTKDVRLFASTIQKSLKPLSLFESGLISIGKSIKSFASYAVGASFIAGIAMSIRSATTAIIDFDQSLKDLQAITGATDREIEVMGDKILDVASKTKFSAQEVALGMKTLGQAGLTASESVQTMQAVADLATGTLTEMAMSVDLVTTAMRVFDISASDSGHVADVFANAVNKSKLTVDKLRIAMNYVGPVAKRAGVSFEDVASSMMVLANSGIRASTIGTGLRQVYKKLVDPSKQLSEGIKNAGLSIDDFNPQMHSMSTIIENLSEVVVTAEDAFQMFGMRGASAISALTESGVSGFDDMYEAVIKSGSAAKMAEKQMEGLGVKIKNMWDKTKNLSIALGKAGLVKALHFVVDIARKLIDILVYLTDNALGRLVLQVTATTVAFALLIATIKSLASIGIVSKFFTYFIGFFTSAPALIGMTTNALNLYSGSASTATTATAGLTSALYASAVAFFVTPIGWIVAGLALITATVVLLISIEKRHKRIMQEKIDTARNLVDSYKDQENAVDGYREKLVRAGDDTKKVISINLDMKRKLMELSKEQDNATDSQKRLNTAALVAANSIDPLTGKIEEGSTAISDYNKLLGEMKLAQIAESFSLVSKRLETQITLMGQLISLTKRLGVNVWTSAKAWFNFKNIIHAIFPVINQLSQAFTYLFKPLMDKFPIIKKAFNWMEKKAEEVLQKIGKANNIDIGGTVDIKDDYLNNGMEYKDFREAVMKAGDALSGLKKELADVELESKNTIEALFGLGRINIGTTEDELIGIVKSIKGYENATKSQIDSLKMMFGIMKKGAADSSSGTAERWAKELDKASESGKEYSIGVVDGNVDIMASMDELDSATINSWNTRRIIIAEESDKNKEAWLSGKKSDKEYIKRKTELNKKARKLNVEARDSEELSKARQLHLTQNWYTLQVNIIKSHYEEGEELSLEHKEALIKIEEDKAKRISSIMAGTYDIKAMKDNMKEFIAEQEKYLSDSLLDIELASSGDRKGTDEGIYEQQKLEATASSHRAIEEEYRIHYENLLKSGKENDKDTKEWHKKYLDSITKRQKSELSIIKKFSEDRDKAEDKVSSITDKRSKELKKHSEKWNKIETDSARKIVEINIAKEEKIQDLIEQRTEIERKTNADIEGMHEDIADKIRLIGQRSMSDKQKERDNEKRANQKLAKGNSDLRKASALGDAELAKRARATIESAGSIYEGLGNSKKAVNGLRSVEKALEEAFTVDKNIEIKGIDKEISKVKKLANAKIVSINKIAFKAETNEFNRHNAEMANLNIELAKWQQKLDIANKLIEVTKSKIEDTGIAAEASAPIAPKVSQDIYQNADGSYSNEAKGGADSQLVLQDLREQKEQAKQLGEAFDTANSKADEYGKTVGGLSDSYAQEVLDKMADIRSKIESGEEIDIPVELAELDTLKQQFDSFSSSIEGLSVLDKEVMAEDLQTVYTGFVSYVNDQKPVKTKVEIDKESLKAADKDIKSLAQTVNVKVKTSQSKEKGGEVMALSRARGGKIPGPNSKKDNTLVYARGGEHFIQNESADTWRNKVGSWFLDAVNAPLSSAGKALMGVVTGNQQQQLVQASTGSVNLTKLNSNATMNEMNEFGTVNFNFGNGAPVPAMMKPTDVSEMMRQLAKEERFRS